MSPQTRFTSQLFVCGCLSFVAHLLIAAGCGFLGLVNMLEYISAAPVVTVSGQDITAVVEGRIVMVTVVVVAEGGCCGFYDYHGGEIGKCERW